MIFTINLVQFANNEDCLEKYGRRMAYCLQQYFMKLRSRLEDKA
jgi:hypothetical protein